jgi:RHS repeat-associated protein
VSALIGQPVTLDGRLSSDPDNDRLRYTWTILSAPVGSAATLTNATSVLASLTPDLAGDYIINLVVNDGTADSAPVAVRITATSGNAAPLAIAGRDRNALANALVTFDGSASRDPNSGTTLTYNWSLASVPAGSTATLTSPTTVAPTFTPIVTGDYLVRLVVNDGVVDSAPATLLLRVASPNAGPNANAGGDQSVAQTELVTLNGTTSADPNGDSLTYQWSLLSVPTGSAAVLSNLTAAQPTFGADLAGQYVIRLIVSDGTTFSVPDLIVVKSQAVTALAVTPVNPTITIGQTQAFIATATLADNSTKDLTNRVTWASSNAAVATINANGLATSVGPGTTVITATAGTVTSPVQTLRVLPFSPTITGFTPASGTVGTVVTITGTNFTNAAQGGTTVRFNGTAAVATSVIPTSITTTVPLGSTTGNISVQTAGGTATSATPFTVTLSVDFQLSGAPSTATTVQGRAATAIVQLTSAGGLSNLVNLAATGLPAGVTAMFSAPVVTLFQPVTLTLTTSAATPVGTIPVTVTGSTTIDGQPIARSTIVNLSVIASGTTTLSGRVLRAQDDVPLQGVTVKIGAITGQTDASGRFLLNGVPAGTQILMIDGTTVTNPPGTYHTLPAQVNLVANQANELSFISYLPLIDTTAPSHIDPATTSIIQDPRIPGLSFTIPTGTELRSDLDGSLITDIAITPVSPSRIPLPPPGPGLHIDPGTVYMMYFFKPGGAIPSQKITQFSLPNDLASAPGRNIIFYYFDSSPTVQPGTNQWKLAGTGKISADGKLALPDPGIGFPKFCCALIFWCNAGDATQSNLSPDDSTYDGDPVDLATGQLVLRKTDLVLSARLPIAIARGYHSGAKTAPGPFGKGTFFNLEKEAQSTESGLVITYTQGNGRTDLLSRQPDGTFQNTTIASLRGLVLSLQADGSKRIRWRDGTLEQYGTDGRLTQIEDRNGNTITIERNGVGQILRILDASGLRALTFQYDAGGRILQIIDLINRSVQYTYNAAGFLETVTDPTAGITRYVYDATGNMLTATDPRAITFVGSEYDTKGRVIRQTAADGGVFTFSYGTFGTTITDTTVTDPRGNKKTTRFNAQLYGASVTNRLGQQTRKIFDMNNHVTEMRDELNRVAKYTYDQAGNITSVLNPQGNVTLYEYEPTFNLMTKITDSLNQVARFTYDARGNLLALTDPLNHTMGIVYNQFGQPTSFTDGLNNTTIFEYDQNGNLATTTDPLGNRTQGTFDAVSRMILLTNPRGKTTQIQYDNLDRITQMTDAINSVTSFTYDPNGNVLTVTDGKNQTTTFTYDNLDRISTRKDSLNRTESYEYDLDGNLVRFTDRKQQVSQFAYDVRGRRIGATYQDGNNSTLIYDTLGRLAKVADTTSGTIEYGYDVLDHVIQETTPQGTILFQYDALGRRTQMTANGSAPLLYQYDAASQLTRVEQGSVFAVLSYDNANRRTSLGYSNGTITSYGYDAATRLINITHNGPAGLLDALTYSYDAASNRVNTLRTIGSASLLPSPIPSATYDGANEQTQVLGANLTYDQNGNLTNDGTNTYQWDARNRLMSIAGGLTANFVYDAYGRRVSKTINGQTTQFLYDGSDIAQEIGTGAVGATYLRSLNIDEPFVRQGTANEFYHIDALGSTLALSNMSGSSTVTYNYEPFGRTTSTGTSTNPFQYTGREQDSTVSYYYRARYYSPDRQRFLSQDPIGFSSGETNFYAYTGNNPIDRRDPLGLWSPACHWGITNAAATACGFSDNDATALANAVRGQDYMVPLPMPIQWLLPIPSFSTMDPSSPAHGMPGTSWTNYDYNQLAAAGPSGCSGSLAQGLHARQDWQSHGAQNIGMWDHVYHPGQPSPDDCNDVRNQGALDTALKNTVNAIRDFMKARGAKPKCRGFD